MYKTTDDTAATLHTSGSSSPEFLSFVNSATAYVNLTTLLSIPSSTTSPSSFLTSVQNAAFDPSLVPSTDPTVVAGYKAIYNTTLGFLQQDQVGAVEMLLSVTGTSQGGAGSVAVQAALQHPLR